jgi:hypothetical protein
MKRENRLLKESKIKEAYPMNLGFEVTLNSKQVIKAPIANTAEASIRTRLSDQMPTYLQPNQHIET